MVITAKAGGAGCIAAGPTGNLEVAVPEGNNLVHYWAAPGKAWNRAATITDKATGSGAIIQSKP